MDSWEDQESETVFKPAATKPVTGTGNPAAWMTKHKLFVQHASDVPACCERDAFAVPIIIDCEGKGSASQAGADRLEQEIVAAVQPEPETETEVTAKSLSFRCPVTQSPSLIAHTFNYEPFISLKIDGLFCDVDSKKYKDYNPVFPSHWTKVEGEYYETPNHPPILYVFHIQSSDKIFDSLSEMYAEIESYFIAKSGYGAKQPPVAAQSIQADMIANIQHSYSWRDIQPQPSQTVCWFPKKYWKLDNSSWNNYLTSSIKFSNLSRAA